MFPLFLGGHPALDFLNSSFSPQGRPIETIPDGAAYIDWLIAAGLLSAADAEGATARHDPATLDRTAATARVLRERARAWIERWAVGDTKGRDAAVSALDGELAHGLFVWRFDAAGQLVPQPQLDDPAALNALVARALALLIGEEDPALVRQCAGSGCTLLFLDRTKAHRRRYCSATACGNRAKVAAFRQRKLEG